MTKEEKLEELEAAATAYCAMEIALKDFDKNRPAAEARLKNHFNTIGITWPEWQSYIKQFKSEAGFDKAHEA